jgi:MFS family permease
MSEAASPGAQVSTTAIFRKRDFSLLWIAQLVSTAGSALTDLAAGIYVFNQTGSALAVGLTLMATAVPSLVVGLLAGVVVDRYDRRKVMILSNLAQAFVVALIPFLLGVDITLLFIALLVNAGVKQFFDPAYETLIPEIASDEELHAANAFLQIAAFGSNAIGFAAAGLLASIDIELAFWIDALTFLFSAGCIALLRVDAKVEVTEETSVGVILENLKTGIRTVATTPLIRSLFLIGVPATFGIGLWNVLLLPMTLKALNATEFEYGIQEALTSVGFVTGALFMARYAPRLASGTWMFVGYTGMAVAGVAYGLSPTVLIAIPFAMMSGFFNSPPGVARQTLLQRNTPRELRGRVFSAMFVMRDIVFLAGMAGAGLADIIDVRALLIIASLIVGAAGILALVMPGVGRPAAEWRKALSALGAAPTTPVEELAGGRVATLADFDVLVGRLGTFRRLNDTQRATFLRGALIRDVPEGTRIVASGDKATAAFFILDGEAVAAIPEEDGGYRGLSTMSRGDFFGEIAALTGSARTADVVATEPSTMLEVPADALRSVMEVPEVSELVLSTLNERLTRTTSCDLPRVASRDQSALRLLMVKAPEVEEPENVA